MSLHNQAVEALAISWHEVVRATVLPQLSWSKDYLTGLIAVLGTTISPYLFFLASLSRS